MIDSLHKLYIYALAAATARKRCRIRRESAVEHALIVITINRFLADLWIEQGGL